MENLWGFRRAGEFSGDWLSRCSHPAAAVHKSHLFVTTDGHLSPTDHGDQDEADEYLHSGTIRQAQPGEAYARQDDHYDRRNREITEEDKPDDASLLIDVVVHHQIRGTSDDDGNHGDQGDQAEKRLGTAHSANELVPPKQDGRHECDQGRVQDGGEGELGDDVHD